MFKWLMNLLALHAIIFIVAADVYLFRTLVPDEVLPVALTLFYKGSRFILFPFFTMFNALLTHVIGATECLDTATRADCIVTIFHKLQNYTVTL